MNDAEDARDKGEFTHRALSLALFLGWMAYELLIHQGFARLRYAPGYYTLSTLLIWFPDAFAYLADGVRVPKLVRLFGWFCLGVVPLLYHGLEWATD